MPSIAKAIEGGIAIQPISKQVSGTATQSSAVPLDSLEIVFRPQRQGYIFVPRGGVYEGGAKKEPEEGLCGWPFLTFLPTRSFCFLERLTIRGLFKAITTGVLTLGLTRIYPSECSVDSVTSRPNTGRYLCEFRNGKYRDPTIKEK